MELVPSNAYGLLHLKGCDKRLPIDGRDLVDAQSRSHENQGRVEILPVRLRDLQEDIFVDIRPIARRVYSQRLLGLVGQCPA